MSKFVCWFVKITGILPQFILFRTKVHYRNKKAQSRKINGPAIVVSNHSSIYDFAVMMFVFWRNTLRCLVAAVIYNKNKFTHWLLKRLGGIKIERKAFDFKFVDEAVKILEHGGIVEIYPEARLPLPNEKRPLPFKPSAAYIAMLSGAPIIPVYTNGSYFNLKKRAHVMIGEKIDTNSLIDPTASEKENIEKITDHLRNVIVELGNELNEEIKTR
mgnify:FL=1